MVLQKDGDKDGAAELFYKHSGRRENEKWLRKFVFGREAGKLKMDMVNN